MKIKNIYALAALFLAAMAITSCNNKKFQISGTIADAKDSVLYLENIGLDGPQVIDSVKLAENGEFVFSEKATDAPEFYRLRIARNIVNVSIDSTETITVKASYPTMAYKYEIEGSDNCKKIQELTLLQQGLQNQINAIIRDPNLGVNAVEDSIIKVVNAYKDNVKHKYIFVEPNKAYAYFALFQTIVVGNSYNLIFNPQSSEEDVKVFGAVATSWDTFYPGAVRGENLHNIAIESMKNKRILQNRQAQAEQLIDESIINESGIIDIALFDNKGTTRRLTDLKGQVVLLDFTVFGMDNSRERTLQLRELYNKYHAQGFEIYQVSLDSEEHFWKTQTSALPWISVYDPQGMNSALVQTFNLFDIPTFFLVDRNNVLYKRDAQISDLDAEIKSLL